MRRSCSSPGPLLKILGSILSTYEWMQLCFPVLKVSVLPLRALQALPLQLVRGTAWVSPRAERFQDLQQERSTAGQAEEAASPLGQAREGEGTLQDEGAGLSQCCIHPKQVGCAGCWLHPCAALGLGCRAGRSPG